MSAVCDPMMYEPFDTSLPERQIRLVVILPSQRGSQIKCSLVTVNLDSNTEPKYEAFSYEWGLADKQMYEIDVDGKAFPVRQNLWTALDHLRPKENEPSLLLWIDAICIDQTNIAERNQQISMMGEIYKKATLVRAWLGLPDGSTRKSLRLLDKLNRLHLAAGGNSSIGIHIWWKIKCHLHQSALLGIFERTYWTRVWIIQEVAFARDLIIHCGRNTFEWHDDILYIYLRPQIVRWLQRGRPFGALQSVLNIREMYRFPGATMIWLPYLLDCTFHSGAADPRDRVFAVLGLAGAYTQTNVPVDYGCSTERLVELVVMYCFGEERLGRWKEAGTRDEEVGADVVSVHEPERSQFSFFDWLVDNLLVETETLEL